MLVVEDNIEVGKFATDALTELGYGTTLVDNATHALEELAAGAERYDVVFTDVVMPGMTGIELAQEIRRYHPDLPVVLTSGYSHVLSESGSDGLELLQKPYSIEQLSRVLHRAGRWRRVKRATAARRPDDAGALADRRNLPREPSDFSCVIGHGKTRYHGAKSAAKPKSSAKKSKPEEIIGGRIRDRRGRRRGRRSRRTAAAGSRRTRSGITPEEAEQARKDYLLTRFWISARGYWGRNGDRLAWLFSIGLLILIVVNVGFQYGINVWNRAIFDAIEKRESATVFYLTAVFLPLAIGSVLLGVAQVFARMSIQRRWRSWLTSSVMTRWLANGRYYQLNLVGGDHKNPEYRIAEDLRIATDSRRSISSPASPRRSCRPRPSSWCSGPSAAR